MDSDLEDLEVRQIIYFFPPSNNDLEPLQNIAD